MGFAALNPSYALARLSQHSPGFPQLARFFGTSAEFWMNLQTMHDLTKARQERGRVIDRDVRPRAA